MFVRGRIPNQKFEGFFLQQDMRHSTPKKHFTSPKTNMDTQNDGLEKVTPLKTMAIFYPFWYLC